MIKQFDCKQVYHKSFVFTKFFKVKQYIWPINRALSGASTLGQCGSGSNDNEGVLRTPQSYCITVASPSDCLMSFSGHLLGWRLTPLQWCSRCILQPQPTGLTLGRVLPFSRDAVGVFYNPSQLGHRSLVGGSSLKPLQRCSRRILQPQSTGLQNTC